MIIRKMRLEDVSAIAKLEQICFSDPWSEASIKSELNNPLSYWLVADDNGTIAGYVGSQSVLDSADMMNIAVAPEYRRRGVGRMLINNLISYLREQKVIALLLEVRVSNMAAISLYQKFGFQQVGRRPRYYHNPREDALIFRKGLVE